MLLKQALQSAKDDGVLTAEEHEKLMAFDWQGFINTLLPFLSFIPGIGAFLPLLAKLIPYLIQWLQQNANVVPDNGGGGTIIPTPVE